MSGESDDYTDEDIDDLLNWLERAFNGFSGGDTMRITAKIEFSGTYNRIPHRTINVGGMDLGPVQHATAEAVQARTASTTARPAPKTWRGQLNWLQRTKSGRDALQQAGFSPAKNTVRRWLTGRQQPGPAYRAKLAAATEQRYGQLADAREQRYRAAARAAADVLTEQVLIVTAGDARFREITQLEFE